MSLLDLLIIVFLTHVIATLLRNEHPYLLNTNEPHRV
jgi:hypothetical protein